MCDIAPNHVPDIADLWNNVTELKAVLREVQGDIAELKEILSDSIERNTNDRGLNAESRIGFGTRITAIEKWQDQWERDQRERQRRIFTWITILAVPAVIGCASTLTSLAMWAVSHGFKP